MRMRVLQLPQKERAAPGAAAVGHAMWEAREAAGLDRIVAARRMNAALGCTIISEGLLQVWETGHDIPDAEQFLAALQLAGDAAARILDLLF